jgi:hypothetical protein
MYKKIFYLIVRIKLIVPKMLYNLPFPRIFFIRIPIEICSTGVEYKGINSF